MSEFEYSVLRPTVYVCIDNATYQRRPGKDGILKVEATISSYKQSPSNATGGLPTKAEASAYRERVEHICGRFNEPGIIVPEPPSGVSPMAEGGRYLSQELEKISERYRFRRCTHKMAYLENGSYPSGVYLDDEGDCITVSTAADFNSPTSSEPQRPNQQSSAPPSSRLRSPDSQSTRPRVSRQNGSSRSRTNHRDPQRSSRSHRNPPLQFSIEEVRISDSLDDGLNARNYFAQDSLYSRR
ncbi:hypothetical protein P7C73_g2357, partial [Tremellales sp. Uapishka_1]